MNYPGQVFYVSPLEDQYPLATFDSVLDQGQTQEEIGIFRLSSIQNGLNATSIFSYPGKFETKKKEIDFRSELNEFIGGKGPGVMVVEDDGNTPRKAQDLITHLTLPNNDKIHEFISRDDKNAIMEAFAMPKGILGVLPESGMFNQQQLEEEYNYYNSITRDYRADISEALKKIFANWHQPVMSEFKIKELQYTRPEESVKEDSSGKTKSLPPEQLQAQAQLKGSVGGVQGILSLQASVAQGITGVDAGVAILIEIYGFREDVARRMLMK
jgi:hypothetical protein